MSETVQNAPDSRRRVPRTRGATSGVLLMILGAWGALVPFIGPLFHYGFTPNSHRAWYWTAARGWYEVLPGAVAFLGGLLLLISTRRTMTMIGAWLGIAAGTWFIIGPAISTQLTLGPIGSATGDSAGLRVISVLGHFYLLGAVILFLASAAFGRLSVVSLRDVRVAEEREAARIEAEEAAARDAAAADLVMRQGEQRRAREAEAPQAAPGAPNQGGYPSAFPTTGQPTTGQPTTGQPTTGQPTTGQPTTGQPTTEQPTTEQPATAPPPTAPPESPSGPDSTDYGRPTTYAGQNADQPSGYPPAPPPPPPSRSES